MHRVLFCLSLAACASAPPVEGPVAEQVMAEATQRLQDGDVDGAADLVLAFDETEFVEAWQPRYAVLRARIHLQQGEPWEAYLALREFADNHPHSELRSEAIALEFQAGSQLAESDGGFLFFWSDKRGARTCLEHLTTRYPNCPQFAEAMQLLGKLALDNGDYQLAEERYRELLRRFPESEWAPLARFQFAMSIYAALRGADYDLDRMESASRELEVYLQGNPENPDYRTRAAEAKETLRNWRAERHVSIAAFYDRVENRPGEVEHLHMALAPEFQGTAAAEAAALRLAELGDPKPAAQLPPRSGAGTKP